MPINSNRNPVTLLFVLLGVCGLSLSIVFTLDIATESSMSRAVHSDVLSGLVIVVAGAFFWIGAHAYRALREMINAMRSEVVSLATRIDKVERDREAGDEYAAGVKDGLEMAAAPLTRRLTAVPPQ